MQYVCVINQNLGTTIFPLFGDDNTCKLFTKRVSTNKQELIQTIVKQNIKIEKQKRKIREKKEEHPWLTERFREIDAGTGIECALEVCTLDFPLLTSTKSIARNIAIPNTVPHDQRLAS